MFNMFNIIETPHNYFTCELLHDNLSSDVVNFADVNSTCGLL